MGNPGLLIQGTGLWKVDSVNPTGGLELSANPHWWGGKVPVQHESRNVTPQPESSRNLALPQARQRSTEMSSGFRLHGL
jgi:ABC-type transport system substrate-binding protein